MSPLRRLHHEDQRRQLQPHELHRVRLSVLLAVYAGDHRRALPQVRQIQGSAPHSFYLTSPNLDYIHTRTTIYDTCTSHRPGLTGSSSSVVLEGQLAAAASFSLADWLWNTATK